MKRKEIKKLHQLKINELKEKLVQARKELVELKMVSGKEKTKDVKAVAKKRDEIARIATILKEKELLEEARKGPSSFAKASADKLKEKEAKNEKVSG